MEPRTIQLEAKPDANLRASAYIPTAESGPLSDKLVVFLNGLALPRAAWVPAITQFLDARAAANQPVPALLTYDRFGQGDSDPDPSDLPGMPYGHDADAVIVDLHQLLTQFAPGALGRPLGELQLVFVCNSIGCALARLYVAAHPGTVTALMFLDSMMANSDFVSVFPDPDAPGFDEGQAKAGADELRRARASATRMFHPTVPNPEHLDRRNLGALLPDADEPKLTGPSGPPRVVVVGHDPEEFANQSEKPPFSVAREATLGYLQPAWAAYNAGLATLGAETEVKIAKGCGHFIQRDDPGFVATELGLLLNEL